MAVNTQAETSVASTEESSWSPAAKLAGKCLISAALAVTVAAVVFGTGGLALLPIAGVAVVSTIGEKAIKEGLITAADYIKSHTGQKSDAVTPDAADQAPAPAIQKGSTPATAVGVAVDLSMGEKPETDKSHLKKLADTVTPVNGMKEGAAPISHRARVSTPATSGPSRTQ